MKVINPLNHPHAGKAAILIAIAIVLAITVHEVFFLVALLIAAVACVEWGAHEVHVIHEPLMLPGRRAIIYGTQTSAVSFRSAGENSARCHRTG